MLTRLYVNNYRCLVNFEFRPTSKQLIIGRNGSGKSTVLDVLSLLRDFSVRGNLDEDPREDRRKDRLVGDTKTRWQPGIEQQQFELEVEGNGGEYHYILHVDEWGVQRRPRVLREIVHYSDGPIFHFENGEVFLYNDRHEEKATYPFDWHRSALATIQERPENTKLTWFKRWLGSLLHVQIDPWDISARSEVESIEPATNMENFADWYRHLLLDNGTAVYKAMTELKEVLPGFESLDAKEAGMNVRYLQASIRSTQNRKLDQYLFSELSEGQKVLIVLYLLNHCAIKSESTLVIDEPDNFIALAEIQPWLFSLLDRVDEKHAQVILVSHHPELLDQLAGQNGLIFDRPEGQHTRLRHFDPSEESGLTPAELIARGWEGA